MKIRFTHHANEKFKILKRHGVLITKNQVEQAILQPEYLDSVSRRPQFVAQITLDNKKVLRVVYKIEHDSIVIITFYPGRKSQYEKK